METKKAFFYLKQKNALFIDARDFRFYKRKRIKGAISLPFSEKEEWRNILNDVSSERILITYCDSKICSLGRNLANYLKKHGFENVFTLEGGIDLWEERGLPIEQSDI
jgi:rhodanese-related sulfurtransferase